jgi:hypothetical protein
MTTNNLDQQWNLNNNGFGNIENKRHKKNLKS